MFVQASMGGHGRLQGVWAQQMVQDAEGARAGERISGGWECRLGAPFDSWFWESMGEHGRAAQPLM